MYNCDSKKIRLYTKTKRKPWLQGRSFFDIQSFYLVFPIRLQMPAKCLLLDHLKVEVELKINSLFNPKSLQNKLDISTCR